MNKAGLWMVYDNEWGLVCTGDYATCLKEYKKHAKDAVNYSEPLSEFPISTEEAVILARVEKHMRVVEVEDEVYEWKEEDDAFTAEGDQSAE